MSSCAEQHDEAPTDWEGFVAGLGFVAYFRIAACMPLAGYRPTWRMSIAGIGGHIPDSGAC